MKKTISKSAQPIRKATKTSDTVLPVSPEKAMDELGVTGLVRQVGNSIVDEEWLRELKNERGRRTYREMRDNDPTVGAILFAIEMLCRTVEWRLEGDETACDFIKTCTEDMSHTWEDFIAEVLSLMPFGFSFHEVIYKKRDGKNSKFTDGKIGWAKLPIRSQDSLLEWVFDDAGEVKAFVQSAPPKYERVEIPLSRALLFRTTSHKGNPEGRSLLRNAYRPWFFKKKIENIEGIGIERDLAGLPIIYLHPSLYSQYEQVCKQIVTRIRNDEQRGVLLPRVFDDKGNPMIELKLLSAAGSKQLNVSESIERYDKRIAMVVLADFVLLGQQAVGSFALADSKTDVFATALSALLKGIAAVLNRVAIPRLLALNGMDVKETPKFVPGDFEKPELDKLGQYLTAIAGAGVPIAPHLETENYLRKLANLPQVEEGEMDEAAPEPPPTPPNQDPNAQQTQQAQIPPGQPGAGKPPGKPPKAPATPTGKPGAAPAKPGAKQQGPQQPTAEPTAKPTKPTKPTAKEQ